MFVFLCPTLTYIVELTSKLQEAKLQIKREVQTQMAETKFKKIQKSEFQDHWEALAAELPHQKKMHKPQ